MGASRWVYAAAVMVPVHFLNGCASAGRIFMVLEREVDLMGRSIKGKLLYRKWC